MKLHNATLTITIINTIWRHFLNFCSHYMRFKFISQIFGSYSKIAKVQYFLLMVAAPLILGGNSKFRTKIIGGGGPEQKIKFGRGAKFREQLQHFTSRKLAEANFLLNIKKCSFMSACQNCQNFLFVCLSLQSACLSVKLQWMIQVTREIQGNSWIQEFWVCCK